MAQTQAKALPAASALERRITGIAVVLPSAGFLAALWVLWGGAVSGRDLAILPVAYVLIGFGVAKYANASTAVVTLQVDDAWAEITLADDGAGGARTEDGGGLRGLCDRVEALGGRLTLASPVAKGTTLRARIPLAKPGSLLIASGTA